MTIAITSNRVASARLSHVLPVTLDIVEQSGSTNADNPERIESLTQPTRPLALSQTSGRVRNGRAWCSRLGASRSYSLSWTLLIVEDSVVDSSVSKASAALVQSSDCASALQGNAAQALHDLEVEEYAAVD